MKKRLGTVLLLALFVISSMMPTSAATAEIWNEARASHYFDAYMLGISAKGGGEMAVSFGVFGTDTMDKIGVYSLRIESEIAPNKWIEEFTVYGSSDPDTFYAMDTIQHGGDFYFDGMPGVKYRAVMVAYAKNASTSAGSMTTAIRSWDSEIASSVPSRPAYFFGTLSNWI